MFRNVNIENKEKRDLKKFLIEIGTEISLIDEQIFYLLLEKHDFWSYCDKKKTCIANYNTKDYIQIFAL